MTGGNKILFFICIIRDLIEYPQETLPNFHQAMDQTLKRIVERDRMEHEWAKIWKARRAKGRA